MASNILYLHKSLMVLVFGCVINWAQPPVAVATGYATGTTGGAGGSTIRVSTSSELITACNSNNAAIIVVERHLGSVGTFNCRGNKTLIGRDTTAGFNGNLRIANVSNVIVQNLTISNPDGVGTGDGIEVSGATMVFLHKLTMVDTRDGAIDIVRGADNVTVSWTRFRYQSISGHNFANLIGNGDANGAVDRGKLKVTMHHNWYDRGCESRMPRVRFGTVHLFNNYYGFASTYAIGTGFESTIRLEASVFENINTPWNDMNGMANGAQIGWNNLQMVGSSTPTYAPNRWPVFTPPYSFRLDPVGSVKSLVIDPIYGAGNRLTRMGSMPSSSSVQVSSSVLVSSSSSVVIPTFAECGVARCTNVLQGEEFCSVNGVAENRNLGFLGSGYVNPDNAVGAAVGYVLGIASPEVTEIFIRYASGTANIRFGRVRRGSQIIVPEIRFPSTGTWTSWATITVNMPLQGSRDSIVLEGTTADGLPNIDWMGWTSNMVSGMPCDVATTMSQFGEVHDFGRITLLENGILNLQGFPQGMTKVEVWSLSGNLAYEKYMELPGVVYLNALESGVYLIKTVNIGTGNRVHAIIVTSP